MKKHVVIFEVKGGSDKCSLGFRKDSKALMDSLKSRRWTSEIIFYDDDCRGEIYSHTKKYADAYISRINPGNLKNEVGYFQMLRELAKNGIKGIPHPDTMIAYGTKSNLEKLKHVGLLPEDTYTYHRFKIFKDLFPKSLLKGPRVIKQNRGSTGEGVWRVEVLKNSSPSSKSIPMDSIVKVTEAKDNLSREKTLGEFIDFCVPYLDGENGVILDMPFLERIKEGELRVLLLSDKVTEIVLKKPNDKKESFSATLFSGAKYHYSKPEEWPEVTKIVHNNLENVQKILGGTGFPLLWTMDFILDTDAETKKDTYVLSEINASCVGFSTQLELSEDIADKIINLIETNEDNETQKPFESYS